MQHATSLAPRVKQVYAACNLLVPKGQATWPFSSMNAIPHAACETWITIGAKRTVCIYTQHFSNGKISGTTGA